MTRKDYKLIAEVLKNNISNTIYEAPEYIILKNVVQAFCIELSKDNPRFNADKFLTACGITQ